jgi:membrane protease subunit (stomatin/prohibitin family)
MPIIDLVKWDNPDDLFAWKFPETELSTATQLIVNESQEAVLFKGGKRLDTFGPGRHTLSTQNIPLINKIINLPFGGRSPFTAEVWFLNKAIPLDIKWGTQSRIPIEDPKYHVIVPVGAYGQFGMRIEEAGMFLAKLVGTKARFSRDDMVSYFKGILLSHLSATITSAIVATGTSVLEIATQLPRLSEAVGRVIGPIFGEYGMSVHGFSIVAVTLQEGDASLAELTAAKARAARRQIEGYTYQQEQSFDVLKTAAGNEGNAGAVMGAGMGLGMGLGVGGFVAQTMAGQVLPPAYGVAPPQVAPPPVAPPAMMFHVLLDGNPSGPFPPEVVRQAIQAGRVTFETMAWCQGMAQWAPAGTIPALAALFQPQAPQPPPPPQQKTGG